MRLMTWNILEGLLEAEEDSGRRDDPTRRTKAVDLVQAIDPDVLVLNEALHCREYDGHQRNYGAIFGFPHVSAALYDGEWGNAILSRQPIVDEVSMLIHPTGSRQNRGGLAARIAVGEGTIWIATLHPHPRRRAFKRAADIDAFLERLDGPIVLAGDLNAISPEDQPNRADLTRGFERFTPPGEAPRAVGRFLEAGHILFHDVLPRFGMRDAVPVDARRHTMPTRLIDDGGLSSAMRIDHVLVNERVGVERAVIVHDPRADAASDHYPIVVELKIA